MTFDEYARERLRALLRTATAITGNSDLAQEIVQDVLIKVSRRWTNLEGNEQRDAYVRRMLVNEFISWRRKWARVIPTARIALDRHEPDPAIRNAERDVLRRELERLPLRQQVVLALRYFEGFSDAEIAAALGCRETTVRSYASRGLSALRVQMTPEAATGHTPVHGGSR